MILTYSKEQFKAKIKARIKIHTIREDKHNRWKPGMMIQHWMHNPRNVSKMPHEFGKDQCISMQEIEIKGDAWGGYEIIVDGKVLNQVAIDQLAINDGFESYRQFLLWFGKAGFNGKIIHWTDKRY